MSPKYVLCQKFYLIKCLISSNNLLISLVNIFFIISSLKHTCVSLLKIWLCIDYCIWLCVQVFLLKINKLVSFCFFFFMMHIAEKFDFITNDFWNEVFLFCNLSCKCMFIFRKSVKLVLFFVIFWWNMGFSWSSFPKFQCDI